MGFFKKSIILLKLITKSTPQKEQRLAYFPEHAVQNTLRLILHNKSLQKTGVRITKWSNFITRWGKHYHKIGKDSFGLLQSGATDVIMWGRYSLLQGGAIVITKWGSFFTKWTRYCRVGQELIQSGKVIFYNFAQSLLQMEQVLKSGTTLLQSGTIISKKFSTSSWNYNQCRAILTDSSNVVWKLSCIISFNDLQEIKNALHIYKFLLGLTQ